MNPGKIDNHSTATRLAICTGLAAITWVVFGQTLSHDFVNLDDSDYVYKNPHISAGLSVRAIVWAFTNSHADNWHPLTSISHMLDCQIFGLNAGGHHFTNILLHTIGVILLFLVVQQMTGHIWRSAFVAAVFAVHPLHVESVAWVSERKDILSGIFFMLTLAAYVRYARNPTPRRYITMSILFALGLMSKPMLVTLPLVLLLLDYWPLGRRQVVEKIPLLALSAASCVATLLAQHNIVTSIEKLPILDRLNNAVVACATYIGQMLWPTQLLPYYQHPGSRLPLWQVVAAATILIAISAVVFALRRTRPYLVVGWLWYLIMLVPVIGLVQVSMQGHADRYTYLPQIGLYLMIIWSVGDLLSSTQYYRQLAIAAGSIVLIALVVLAHRQTAHWRNGESLWRYTLSVDPTSALAHFNLGDFYLEHGRIDESIPSLQRALTLWPWFAPAHYQLGAALFEKGELDEAMAHYQKVLALKSDTAGIHHNIALVLSREGKIDNAITEYETALRMQPDEPETETNLANLLLENGRGDEALAHYQRVVQLRPDVPISHYNLAVGLHRQGRLTDAIAEYKKVSAMQSDFREVRSNLGNALLQNGQVDEAKVYLEK